MNKLRLRADDLRVESFNVAEKEADERGTVRGNSRPTFWVTDCYTGPEYGDTCQPVYTCPECASPPETAYNCGPTDDPIG